MKTGSILRILLKNLFFLADSISLRGHCENEELSENFLELPMFQAKNNPSINQVFGNKNKGATYTIPGIHIELLNVIGESIRASIKLKKLEYLP